VPRVRRPLLALIALVAALAIGYGVRAAQDHGHHTPPAPSITSGSTAH
jgi:hypothetical protein